MSFLVAQEHEKCISCGACVGVCSENWVMGSDGKARPLKPRVQEVGCNKKAEEVCPVKIIHVTEE
ncbi:MAG: ferredoxin [archaeon]